MTAFFEPQEMSKLPAWAREKITMLQRVIGDQRADIADLTKALDLDHPFTPGAVEIDSYGKQTGLEKRGARCMPAGTSVDFHLTKYGSIRVQMREIGTLHVMSTHGQLAVRPSAANLVFIESEKIK